MNEPRTKEEVAARRYWVWAGNPKGKAYDPRKCAASVPDGDRSRLSRQCIAKPGKGPDGLYCGTHANQLKRRDAYRHSFAK